MNVEPRLRDYREKAKITQSQLAKDLSMAQCSISQYESGSRVPNYKTMQAIVKAIKAYNVDCSVEDIFAA